MKGRLRLGTLDSWLFVDYTPVIEHSRLENGPGLKMYFLWNMGRFHCYVSLPEGIFGCFFWIRITCPIGLDMVTTFIHTGLKALKLWSLDLYRFLYEIKVFKSQWCCGGQVDHHLSLKQTLYCQVADAGYVEPLSTVSAGTLVEGRVSGVPAQASWPWLGLGCKLIFT